MFEGPTTGAKSSTELERIAKSAARFLRAAQAFTALEYPGDEETRVVATAECELERLLIEAGYL